MPGSIVVSEPVCERGEDGHTYHYINARFPILSGPLEVMRVYKTKGEDRKSETLTIPVTASVVKRLEALAEKLRVPKTEMARRLVMDGLDANHA